ncbi:MAG: discoidin domain-containing protein [Chloroflexi bacterium]|nr:discoidin domain-containing protein [Chloroflexota bacterium]
MNAFETANKYRGISGIKLLKSSTRFVLRLVALLAVAISSWGVDGIQSAEAAPESAQSRSLYLPFKGTWYVCQGYRGKISHTGKDVYALDLTTNKDGVGNNGCTGDINASKDQLVYAPADGVLSYGTSNPDLIYFTLDTGGCLVIGHVVPNAYATGKYKSGQQIGKVAAAGTRNGGYAHIHMSAFPKGCYATTSVPMSSDYNFRFLNSQFQNAPDLISNGATNQYRGLQLSGPGASRPSTSINLAKGKRTYRSSVQNSSYESYRGVDGSTLTRWSSAQSSTLGPQWLIVDLGSSQQINQVITRWEAAYAPHFFVGTSTSSNCETASYSGSWYTVTKAASWSISLSLRSARCVMVYMDQRAPGMSNYSIWEFEVYKR